MIATSYNRLYMIFILIALSFYSCSSLITPLPKFSSNYNDQQYKKLHRQPQQCKIPHLDMLVTAQMETASSTINIAAIKAISKLISTCGIGAWAGRIGLLDQNAISVLSKLIFSLFQPCLLFVNVASTVAKSTTGGAGSTLFLLPLAAIFQILIGFTVGKLVSLLIYGSNTDSESARQLQACTTFGNSGPLPLVFTDGLLRNHADSTLAAKSIAYISLYLLGWSPLFWIIAPAILTKQTSKEASSQEAKAASRKALIKRILSPPVLASISGMVAGFIPFTRFLLMDPYGFLNPVFEGMRTLGAAYLPCVLLVLAGSLAGSSNKADSPLTEIIPNESEKDSKVKQLINSAKANSSFAVQVIAIYMARFLILPLVGFGLIGAANRYIPSASSLFKRDPLLLMILLLETCMPSAQNTTVILQLQGNKDAAGRLARTLMLVYVMGIPAMSYWLVRILGITGLAG